MREFIDKHATNYKSLQVEYERGANPSLAVFDAAGKEAESLNIENWKVDNIVAFLKEKLAA